MSRYAYINTKIWKDKKFRQLSEIAKMLYLAILTAPSSNMIGYYEWPVAYALHDLGGWSEDKFFTYLKEIEDSGMIAYDRDNEVVFVKNFLKHNPLTSVKQIMGGANCLKNIPHSYLFRDFMTSWDRFVDAPFYEESRNKDDENTKRSIGIMAKIARENAEILKDIEREYPQDTLSEGENQAENRVSKPYPGPIDTPSIPYRYPIDTLSEGEDQAENRVSIPYGYPIDTLSIPYRYPIDNQVQVQIQVQDQVQDTPPSPPFGGVARGNDERPLEDRQDRPQAGGLTGDELGANLAPEQLAPAVISPDRPDGEGARPDVDGKGDLSAEKPSNDDDGGARPAKGGKEVGYSKEFEAFYAAYPRRVGKSAAFSAWKTLKRYGVSPKDLITAAEVYSDAMASKGQEADKIAYPSTFLNKDRWRDWLPPDGALYLETKARSERLKNSRYAHHEDIPKTYEEAIAKYGDIGFASIGAKSAIEVSYRELGGETYDA